MLVLVADDGPQVSQLVMEHPMLAVGAPLTQRTLRKIAVEHLVRLGVAQLRRPATIVDAERGWYTVEGIDGIWGGRGPHRQRPPSSARQSDPICGASAVKTDPAVCIPIGGSRDGRPAAEGSEQRLSLRLRSAGSSARRADSPPPSVRVPANSWISEAPCETPIGEGPSLKLGPSVASETSGPWAGVPFNDDEPSAGPQHPQGLAQPGVEIGPVVDRSDRPQY